jgi:hypothetical protein
MKNYNTGTKFRDTTNLQNILRGASGPMKHRCTPRGGSYNQESDFLEEYEEFLMSDDSFEEEEMES